MWIALSLSFAQASPSEAMLTAASDAYGKSIPEVAVCIHEAQVSGIEPFQVVGVTQRRAGCSLLGIWAQERWMDPESAASSLLGDVWSKASSTEQSQLVGMWTSEVLLAFDQPLLEPLLGHSEGKNWRVPTSHLKRRDAKGGTLQMDGSFLYDIDLRLLVRPSSDQSTPFTTRLLLNPYHTRDDSVETVRTALYTRGKAFQDCFDAAWESDLSLSGPVRVQWSIAGGAATAVGVVATDDGHPKLNRCYGSVLQRVVFPDELSGTMVWSFTADRRTPKP